MFAVKIKVGVIAIKVSAIIASLRLYSKPPIAAIPRKKILRNSLGQLIAKYLLLENNRLNGMQISIYNRLPLTGLSVEVSSGTTGLSRSLRTPDFFLLCEKQLNIQSQHDIRVRQQVKYSSTIEHNSSYITQSTQQNTIYPHRNYVCKQHNTYSISVYVQDTLDVWDIQTKLFHIEGHFHGVKFSFIRRIFVVLKYYALSTSSQQLTVRG